MRRKEAKESELTKIFNGRIHLRHTDNISNSTLSSNDATQSIGVFFTKLLEEH